MSWKCFKSKSFIVSVGPQKEEYTVHESHLSKSPVFAKMCSGPFKESAEASIRLPEDDADSFGRVISYLYTKDYETSSSSDGTAMSVLGDELAGVYILAEKYDFCELKEATTDKIRVAFIGAPPSALFDIAHTICENTSEEDAVFKAYFRAEAPHALRVLEAPDYDQISGLVYQGGKLAEDIVKAQKTSYEIKYSELDMKNQAYSKLEVKVQELKLEWKQDVRLVNILATGKIWRDRGKFGDPI
ncbi:hypothetical protein MMC12_006217 [Toensbergia leucococca]|nr:hypothetical protein [Toensbergia leucococca]